MLLYFRLKYTRLLFGQISRVLVGYNAIVKLEESESALRVSVKKFWQKFVNLPGTLDHCLVSLSNDAIPLMSLTPTREGIKVFCDSSILLFIVLTLAQHTNWMCNHFAQIITQSTLTTF